MAEHTRTLDFKIAFAIGLGTMIAAGIFSLSGTAVYRIGSSAVVAFVIAAVVAGITAAAYSEFASIYSENGGGYLFTSRTFEDRDLLTYAIGMSLFLGYSGTTAFYLATMDEWFFAFILPESFHVLPRGSVGILAAILLGVLNARGTEESGMFQLLVTGAKVAVLFAFIGGAVSYAGPSDATSTFVSGFQVEPISIVSVAALAFITFFGFSAIAASAGEIIEPRKTVPRAIAASMVTVTVLYTFVIIAMVNAPVQRSVLAQGETAMGTVAASFLGPAGQALIVAGAVFSMVSASNASILAASGIGSLMGRRGQAPRPFARIHQEYGTPFWSVTTAISVIVLLIFVFMTLFGHHGLLLGLVSGATLGLNPLTGFATLNLLLPLAVVNVALIYSRRRFPDIERGFSVPGVPVVPIVGVLANLALIYNLPTTGVALGLGVTIALVGVYLAWGGKPDTKELIQPVTSTNEEATAIDTSDRQRVLVPVARPDRAARYVRLAEALGRARGEDPFVQVLTVTQIPDQTPHEMVTDTAAERADRIDDLLREADLDVEYIVEGQTSRDVGFGIVQTARQDDADLIVMGYPEEHRVVAERVEYDAPCDVVFASDARAEDLRPVNVGAAGGPHHLASLSLVRGLVPADEQVNVILVEPQEGGTSEVADETVAELEGVNTRTQRTKATSVAEGLVSIAAENGGVLVIGASRDRRLTQWVLGSTPDRVVRSARERDVPVLVYASEPDVHQWAEDWLFTIYRHLRRVVSGSQRTGQPIDG